MGFYYEQHYDAYLSSFIITFGIMILLNNFDSSTEYSCKGAYPGYSILYQLFRVFGLDSLYYLFDSAISFTREKGMDIRSQSAGKPRKLYIQIHSVISTFVCMHYFFAKK